MRHPSQLSVCKQDREPEIWALSTRSRLQWFDQTQPPWPEMSRAHSSVVVPRLAASITRITRDFARNIVIGMELQMPASRVAVCTRGSHLPMSVDYSSPKLSYPTLRHGQRLQYATPIKSPCCLFSRPYALKAAHLQVQACTSQASRARETRDLPSQNPCAVSDTLAPASS